MPRWIHTVFTWQHHFVHKQRVESTWHLLGRGNIHNNADQPVFAAAAATTHHSSWTVYCDCADCGERHVHSVAYLQWLAGDSDMPSWVHTVFVRQYDFVHEQRVGSSRYLHSCRILVVYVTVQPVWSSTAATTAACHRRRTVYCDSADCGERSLYCITPGWPL